MKPIKFKRSLQLSALAKDMVMLKAQKHSHNEAKARQHLIERLGHLHGLPQKMAQILSLSELSAEKQEFTALTEYQASLDFEVICDLIRGQLNADPQDIFSEIDPQGISASLGQVHRARLKDGQYVAIKVQYPDIQEYLETDLKALGWLTSPVGGMKKGFDLKAYQKEMYQMLMLELDYEHEALMLNTFGDFIQGLPEYQIPQVIPAFSTKRILTMTWIEGDTFQSVHQWTVSQRQALAYSTLRLFLFSCFHWNTLHSDPHPGNFRFKLLNESPVLGCLDFGCVKKLEPEFVLTLKTLIWITIEQKLDPDVVYELFIKMGFNELFLEPMKNKLPALCQILFAPFLSKEPFDLNQWELGSAVGQILGEDRWNFRFAGPANNIFFIRAYQGLLQYLKALKAQINWQELFTSSVPMEWEENRPHPTPNVSVSNPIKLRIQLKQGEETKVYLKYRAEMAAHLSDIVPENILTILKQKNIQLETIQAKAIAQDFQPGLLFELQEAQQHLKVWLD